MSHRHLVAGPRHAILHHMGWVIAAALALLAFVMIFAVGVGPVTIPAGTVARIVASGLLPGLTEPDWTPGQENIVWQVRLPRVILGALVGASLSLVGAALQSVTRNPLADPHLLGISSGAAFGAILALLHVGMVFGPATVPLFAFAGALATTLAVAGLAHLARATNAGRLVLIGVAISFVITSAGSFGIFLGDPRAVHTVIFWMLGGLGLARWDQLVFPSAALLGCGTFLLLRARPFNAMTLGDESATTLGVPAARFRMSVFLACALLTGTAVAFSGVISFVGLMIPHVVRMVVGGDYRRVLPLSIVGGAIFLVAADVLARIVIPPQDVPIGVVTGLVGGLFFVGLMWRRSGRL